VEIDRRIRVASVYNRKRRKHAEIPGIAHARRSRRVKKRNTCCESASSRTALEVRFVPKAEVATLARPFADVQTAAPPSVIF
jgi:hypothetical protein